jgi:hypothetical protein
VATTERIRDRHPISGSFGTSCEALQIADCRLQIEDGLSPANTLPQPASEQLER